MTAVAATPSAAAAAAAGTGTNAIATLALTQMGKPYRWAWPPVWTVKDPTGEDCSGLVGWSIYQATGKALPHSSLQMYGYVLANRIFTKVPVSQAQPGDAVFFGNPVHHCGIVIGAGQMVEAPTFGINVRVSRIADNPASLRPYAGRIAGAGSSSAGSVAGLDAEQVSNAGIIASVGTRLGASARDIAVAIMTAMDESGLRNLEGGDRDSAGLFQQRTSQGWGTHEQVTDPTYASTSFFKRLLAIPNRNSEKPWEEAQDVQRSAYADGSNYERFWAKNSGGFKVTAQQIAQYELGPARLGMQGITGGLGGSGAQGISPNPLDWGDDAMSAIKGMLIRTVFVVGGVVLVVLGAKNAAGNGS